jgi:hypothetical protein
LGGIAAGLGGIAPGAPGLAPILWSIDWCRFNSSGVLNILPHCGHLMDICSPPFIYFSCIDSFIAYKYFYINKIIKIIKKRYKENCYKTSPKQEESPQKAFDKG